jgi:hypothetical protein
MEDPLVDAAYNDQEIGGLLKAEDRRILSNYVYHLKARRKQL